MKCVLSRERDRGLDWWIRERCSVMRRPLLQALLMAPLML